MRIKLFARKIAIKFMVGVLAPDAYLEQVGITNIEK